MATVLNRVTKKLIKSVNTLNYPASDWIINPDLTSVSAYPSKYWVITGDVVTLMDAATRSSLDASLLSAENNLLASNLDRVIKAIVSALNDGSFVTNSNYTNKQIKTIIRSKL